MAVFTLESELVPVVSPGLAHLLPLTVLFKESRPRTKAIHCLLTEYPPAEQQNPSQNTQLLGGFPADTVGAPEAPRNPDINFLNL